MKKYLTGSETMQSNEGITINAESCLTSSTYSKILNNKKFSSAELWNIQRQRKSLISRRYSF